jgi:hypothetical protein
VNRNAVAKQQAQSIMLARFDTSDKGGTTKQNESNADRVVWVTVGVVPLVLSLFSRGSMTLRIILDILWAPMRFSLL